MMYIDLLKDPRWQRKRLEILTRDDFKCRFCGNKDQTLHIHHQYYIHGAKPWEYSGELLVTLCSSCHSKEESLKEHDGAVLNSLLSCGCSRAAITKLADSLFAFLNDAKEPNEDIKTVVEFIKAKDKERHG